MTSNRSTPMPANVVAVDGPAASGKSTTAQEVAHRLGFAHLDSGALYRAFTLAALDGGVPLQGEPVAALASALPIRIDLTSDGFRPEVAGVDVSRAVRSAAVTAKVSEVSALPAVRTVVNFMLRDAATLHPSGIVMEGRDIGTVVFPDAGLKIYLTASPEERARRRLAQDDRAVSSETVAAQARLLTIRDEADAGRAVAPLRRARDAVEVDTTGLSFEEQVSAIVVLARKAFQ